MIPSQRSPPYTVAAPRRVVLVVEHEAILALELEQILAGAGHEAVIAGNSRAAVNHVADPQLHVLAAIVNLNLPDGIKGHENIRRLRAHIPNLPIVVVTGYSLFAPQADLRGLGGPTARLQKPVEPGRLLQRLGDAIALRSGVA